MSGTSSSATRWTRRHVLGLEGWSREEILLLLEQAEITAGAALPDPAAFVQRMNRLLAG